MTSRRSGCCWSDEGIRLRGGEDDVELLSLPAQRRRGEEHALRYLARERLQVELPALPVHGRPEGPAAARASRPRRWRRGVRARADAARRLAPELWKELEHVGLAKLAREMELPLLPVLARMERAGVKVDVTALRTISEKVERRAARRS